MDKQRGWSCGIPALDQVLDTIWAGDNIVLEVDSMDDFERFAERYCAYTAEAGIKLVYFRFADHPPLVPDGVPVERHDLDPQAGFEQFISEILSTVERNGTDGVYYLFDCLSGLAIDWYSDRMLGNFFRLTCPYLYRYDAVALFVLLRDVHTPLATRVIHNTAQVVLDVYRSGDRLYVLPVKVFERTSPTMYMLHLWDDEEIRPVTQSAVLSEILSHTPHPWIDVNVDWRDPWATTFSLAESVQEQSDRGWECSEDVEALTERLVRMMLSRDVEDDLHALCRRYFDLADLIAIGKRMVGSGLIGGKSVGMLLARRILAADRPELAARLEIHDSFYIGSDVFYSFLVLNDCWWDRHHMKSAEDPFADGHVIQQKLLAGEFAETTEAQFREILDYFGQSPIIVRSSSLLEDAYGNSFSGKYDSVFCANQGDPERRLENFKDAVRAVYASTVSEEALSYRMHRGLLHRDEQMALLVQRVSGEFHHRLYYPHIGGVGYSFNPYVWNRKLDPSQGMLRLVFGLGTRAVDRHDDDYTRIISLDAPTLRPEGSSNDVARFSQRIVNVIDLEDNEHVSRRFEDVARSSTSLPLDLFASRDFEMEARAREHGARDVFSHVLTFDTLLRSTKVPADMRDMMGVISAAYEHPVDIEFTVNFLGPDDYRINLLQCRPFHFAGEITHIPLPDDLREEDVIVRTNGPLIGQSLATELDRIVYVEPERYAELRLEDKFAVARLIGRITNQPGSRSTMLMGPGRWGTKMPELGIPVTFTEIKNVSVLCEVARMHEGLNPDLSLGTHFFNDLVDMDVLYLGLSPDSAGSLLNEGLLERLPNRLSALLPDDVRFEGVVRVIDSEELGAAWMLLRADAIEQQAVVYVSNRCDVAREHPRSPIRR
jgi:hypothetical protein